MRIHLSVFLQRQGFAEWTYNAGGFSRRATSAVSLSSASLGGRTAPATPGLRRQAVATLALVEPACSAFLPDF